jgi:hypothetical protein
MVIALNNNPKVASFPERDGKVDVTASGRGHATSIKEVRP